MIEKRALVGSIILAVVLAASSPALGHDLDDFVFAPAEELAAVRGMVSWDGSIADGYGFTVNKTGVGQYFVGYTSGTFSDRPTVLIQALGTVGYVAYVSGETSSGFAVLTKTADGNPANISFKFIVLGPR